jgi:putative ABC transport system substrate-binding protein
MKRRDFITLLGSAAAAWPLAVRAQQGGLPVIGYLSSRTPQSDVPMLAAIRQGLGAVGYVESRNVAIEYRFANGQYDRHTVLAAELVRRQVAVILSAGDQSASLAAKAATSSIPIVFNTGVDPVQGGLVASINRPGGNATGVFSQATSLVGKSMSLLRELVPGAKTIAVLDNPTNSGATQRMKEADEAAAALGLQVRLLGASTESGIDTAFATLASEPADIMQVMVDGFFLTRVRQIVTLAARYAIPAIYMRRQFAEAGGLIVYENAPASGYHQMGIYAGRILNGQKPGELPVVLSDKFEMVINLKAAKALGLTVPPTMLAIADEVIE